MNLKLRKLAAAFMLTGTAAGAYAGALPESQTANDWYQTGNELVEQKAMQARNLNTAKNVILFVGDGMGVSTLTAARILEGQLQGETGEENFLSFETFPNTALVKTYNTDQQTPDSAGTMTAMMTGVKNRAGMLNLGPMAERGECDQVSGNELTTALTLAERKGKATGVVSTARITHATPAATYSVSPDRDWEDDSKLPEASNCVDIAQQLVNYSEGNGIEVVLGGGLRHFKPNTDGGRRTDGQDLTQVWLDNANGETREFVSNVTELNNLDVANTDKVMGLFTSSHMSYEEDRDGDVEPSLAEMTETAIDLLKKDEQGFFLTVEAGRIDHGHHAGNAYRALTDTHALAKAVQAAVDNTSRDDTLIIVTADHSHVFTIAGYPKRGNPILGKVVDVNDTIATGSDNLPYTTVGYMNGPGFAELATGGDDRYQQAVHTDGRVDLTNINTEGQGFHQESLVPRSSETHAGEDITIHAMGPGSHLFSGVIEQNEVFHVINEAADLGGEQY
ncbi:alkaline phosphatase [Litoribacillus peritrichatus]|uniref:Alkaline phosphatase n=1 Tax=Litoribacillus peritrichatus TaxID=718191 RepID=A0ABP7NDH0_9GAMM